MPVLMPNISPNDKVLSEDWVFDAEQIGVVKTHSDIPMYEADEDSIIKSIKKVEANFRVSNLLARGLAEQMSWESRKPYYLKLFKEICE
jgi:hypothetical protein